ncbi:hypothetical protein [Pseudomonas sp. GCEP-101]|uniref:hypothetical protein n=1 Tax=Pseudomonas sp. GCEP-101 TaxID=2974552 RepID=UPI00223ABB88|nr:hypothetical protein [Pseudomonas sp. GCEP-101]
MRALVGVMACMACMAAPASAEPLVFYKKVSGWVALDGATANQQFSDRRSVLGARGHLDAQLSVNNRRAMVRIELPSNDNLGDNTRTTAVRELWLRQSGERLDLTAGRQFLPEGRSDWLRPQGQFAPRDYTQLTAVAAEQRIGLPALRLDWYATDTATLILAGLRQDRGDLLPSAMVAPLPEDRPLQRSPKDAALARAEWRRGAWELGASYLDGAALYPVLKRNGEVSIYDQRRLAADGSVNLDGDILRWDVAYVINDASAFPGVPGKESWLSLGLDKGVWSDGTLSLQLLHHRAVLPAEGEPLLEAYNQRLSQNFRDAQSWITVNLRQQFDAKHDAEWGHLQGTAGERVSFLRYGWGFRDGWRWTLQGQAAHGSLDSLAGNLSPDKSLLTELRHFY